MTLSIERSGGTFVAELHGIHLARDLNDATWASIHQAYLDHNVTMLYALEIPDEGCRSR